MQVCRALFAIAALGLVAAVSGCDGASPLLPPDAGPLTDTVVVPDLPPDLPGDVAGDLVLPPDAVTDVSGDGAAPDGTPPDVVVPLDCGTQTECSARAEQRATERLTALVDDQDEDRLREFLTDVPKGGDLHHHLSGAVYAETFLEWAREEGGYCITPTGLSLSRSCSGGTNRPIPPADDAFYAQIVAAWSMEGFVATPEESGHSHFFSTFGKFGAISGTHHGQMLADVMSRAASENQVYIELMLTSNGTAGNLGEDTWTASHPGAPLTVADLPTFYGELINSAGLDGAVQPILTDVTQSEQRAQQILGCDGASPQSGCSVATRYIVFISRSGAVTGVFAQMVAAFEAAIRDPRVVAVNLVGPEDGTAALSRYDLEMEMLGYLHGIYRETNASPLRVTLHAGELAPAYTPAAYPINMINHIRKAVEIARADRIGHGVDVLMEANSQELLDLLVERNVLVEIGLSSNVQILEVSGEAHPLATYLDNGVPVALATDDQAVSRSSMAGEYLRAVTDQALDYRQLKAMARTSLEGSFLPGASLWSAIAVAQAVADCAPVESGGNRYLGDPEPTEACSTFLGASERARIQWELERRFHDFEAAQ